MLTWLKNDGWFKLSVIGVIAVFAVTVSRSNYTAPQPGTAQTVVAFDSTHSGTSLCAAATTQCPATVLIDSAGAEKATVANPAVTISSSQYPSGATPITATATGTTAATTATLAASGGAPKTYVCGFSIRANATAAATGNATMTGVVTATMNFTQWTAPTASGLGVTEMIFTPCIPSSATNTAIAVVSAAPGTGGVVSVSAWGYQL
jgi:hypothetical protein